MLVVLKKVIYMVVILVVNLYICSYINSIFTSRIELKRGYRATKMGGLSYPAVKLFKYLSRDYKINIWEVFIFLFSFLMWSVIPITPNLVLVNVDYSLFVGIFFYILVLILNVISGGETSYNFLFAKITKKIGMTLSFLIPIIFSATSIVLVNRTMSLKEIVNSQYEYWNIVYQPMGFLVVFAAIMFQFKLSGINKKNLFIFSDNAYKEGGGFGKVISRLSGYLRLFFLIITLIILYLGGWHSIYFIRGEAALILKFYIIFVILLLLDKATSDFDDYIYLSNVNWRFLIPISIINFVLTLGFLISRNVFNFI